MINRLFDLGVETFIESSLDNDDELRKPLVFIHIGKTAGSSFREELADRFQPCENVFVDFSKVELPVTPEKYAAIMESNLADLNDNRMRRCRMVSGHFSYSQISRQPDLARGRLITFLRNPISRLTSSYEYHGSAAHPDRDSFKAQYPTFRHYIQDPQNINEMYRQLTPANFSDGADAAEWIKQNYYWIGLQENYVASVKLLFAMNGMRFSPQHSIRKSESSHTGFSAEDIRLAEELNRFDLQIFNSFNERYASMWAEIYHWTDFDRIFSQYLSK
ncbi:sulfotransferase family 2 domain-containing protein [Paraburkholderia sp. Tr-20389]|uniref:sulfotransferase family 2 domain-containing protein n=1 Tax=Paraburkholderia sp. Tr-20389 TaxID=2703903 RepID=UPI00197CEB49|nr:sulfotransferase family 2 domain-containing protein [Paraburkholderia sp. Tr-20389]MBN3753914.1 sulfotransferase family 2 domain-containing protein [Paraburkholderia sp. Tr-20389]